MIDNKPISKVMYGENEIPIQGGVPPIDIVITSDFTTANDVLDFIKSVLPSGDYMCITNKDVSEIENYGYFGTLILNTTNLYSQYRKVSNNITTVDGQYTCYLRTGDVVTAYPIGIRG